MCGCDGVNIRVQEATLGTCQPCSNGNFWAGGVNTGTTCTTCGTGLANSRNSACNWLSSGYYWSASEAAVLPCKAGHVCPGYSETTVNGVLVRGNVIQTLPLANQRTQLIHRELQQDQGAYACPEGTTNDAWPGTGTKPTAAVHCNKLLPGWMYFPSTTTTALAAGYTTYPATDGGVWRAATATLTGVFTAIMRCKPGGYCPGGTTFPGSITFSPSTSTKAGFVPCPVGKWSEPGAVSEADCHLLSPKYYWTGSAVAECPANSFCPGGLSVTGRTTPAGIYKCTSCTGTTDAIVTNSCDCTAALTGGSATPGYTGKNGVGNSCSTICAAA